VIGRFRIPDRRRAVYHGLVLAGLVLLVYVLGVLPLLVPALARSFGYDAHAYWAVDIRRPYTEPLGQYGFFPYSPVAALAAQPLTLLPWPLFVPVWWGLLLAAAGCHRALRGQHPPAAGSRHRARLPLLGGMVVRAPDEGDAGHRVALVRGSA
jgi:hypothetical protein